MSETKEWRPEGWITLPRSTHTALDDMDEMPSGLRQCVHEYGYSVVKTLINVGVKKPGHIHAVIADIRMGARQPHQRMGHHGDGRSPVAATLDSVLLAAGSEITAATLLRVLWNAGMVILPWEPSILMVDTSMSTVSDHSERVTKEQKHRKRLRAAIQAQAKKLWPQIWGEK